MEVQTGTLNLSGGGTHTGSFDVPAGTTLNLRGTQVSSGGSSMTGAGNLTVGGGTATLAGLVNVSGTHLFDNGTANLTGNYICTNNTLLLTGGTINFNGTGTVTPAVVNMDSGTLGGNQTVTVLSQMNWTGGTMTGVGRTIIPPGAALNVAATVSLTGGRTLDNGGTILWTGGNFGLSGAVITNRAGALFEARNAAGLNYTANLGSRFDNAGTFRKSVNAGTTTIFAGMAFNNYNTVEVQTGTLNLSGGGTHTGSFDVPAGTTLNLRGTQVSNGGSSMTGAGNLTVGGGTATLAGLVNVSGTHLFDNGTANLTGNYICTNNTLILSGGTINFNGTGTVTPAVLNLSGGSLGGNQTVTVLNQMNWTGGTMSGVGRTIIPPGAALNVAATVSLTGGRTLENGGTILWTDGNFALSGAVITNRAGALFEARNAAGLNYTANLGSRFDNAGTFRKSVNTGTTTVFAGMVFNNYNTVEVRAGILVANGGYASTSNSLLNCALGGTTVGTGFGRLHVSGNVTLNGALTVNLINGFVPTTNDTFTILTAGTRSGAFANFFYPSNAAAMQLSNTANSVIVRVTDVFSVPQPAALPAGLISWWRAEGNALDHVGTNHGVLTNGATFATGRVGQTFTLDGTDDLVQIPDSPSLRPASVTIEAWVKFSATNGIRLILAKPLGTGTLDSYGLALQDGAVLAAICDNSGFGPFLIGPANTVTGQWYHLAYTFDDGSKQQVLYVNGIPVASGTANKTMSYDAQPVLLGADLENGVLGYFHQGQIDEASLYNRALTSDEIATIYNAGGAGKQLFVAPPPILRIEPISPFTARLFWSTNHPDFHLESNRDLKTTNWANVWQSPVVVGTNNVVTNSFYGAKKFYRLSRVPAPYTNPPPTLQIEKSSGANVRLKWLADEQPFTLLRSTNLTTTNWTVVTPSPIVSGEHFVVTNAASGQRQFYRLRWP